MIQQDTVVNWLSEESVTATPLATANEGVHWALEFQYPGESGLNLNIFCTGKQKDVLQIQREIGVAQVHRTKLKQLSIEEFQTFKFRLVRDLLLFPCQYRITDEGNQDIAVMAFVDRVFEDDFSRGRLIASLSRLHDATLAAIIHVRRAVGDQI